MPLADGKLNWILTPVLSFLTGMSFVVESAVSEC